MTGHEVFRNDDEDWNQDDEFILQDWGTVDDEGLTSLVGTRPTDADRHNSLEADEVLLVVDVMDGIDPDSDLASTEVAEELFEDAGESVDLDFLIETGEPAAAVDEFEIDWGNEVFDEGTLPLADQGQESNWLGIPESSEFVAAEEDGRDSCDDSLVLEPDQDDSVLDWSAPDSERFDLLDDDSEELVLVGEDGFEDLETDLPPLQQAAANWEATEDGLDGPGNSHEDYDQQRAVNRRPVWAAAIMDSRHRRSLLVAAILMVAGLPVGYLINSGWWGSFSEPTAVENLATMTFPTRPAKPVVETAKPGLAPVRGVGVAKTAGPAVPSGTVATNTEAPQSSGTMAADPSPFRADTDTAAPAWSDSVTSNSPALKPSLIPEPGLLQRRSKALSTRADLDLGLVLADRVGGSSSGQNPKPIAVVPDERQLLMGVQAIATLANDNVFVGAVKNLSSTFVTLRTTTGEITFARDTLLSLRPLGLSSGKPTQPSMVGSYVRLRNRNRLSGLIVETRKDVVVLQVQSNQVLVPRTEIHAVIHGDSDSPVQIREFVHVDQDEWFRKLVERGIEQEDRAASTGSGPASTAPDK
jgi:hypothetical protein